MGIEPDWIRDSLSLPRFARYLARAGGDRAAAIELYRWNVAISAGFYASLHYLEVSLRNGLHRQLTILFGRDDWWESAPLDKVARGKVREARRKLNQRGLPWGADDMVAALTLGYWVSLLSKGYDQGLWRSCLHQAFPLYRGPRGSLHDWLVAILYLRNRIMHHEPIHHRDLEADHRKILRVLGYLSPAMVKQLEPDDPVPVLLKQRPRRTAGS